MTHAKEDERINNLRMQFESGKIKQEDMNECDVVLLNFIYELELLEIEQEIDEKKQILESYKTRLRNAIDYLKSNRKENN